MKLRLDANELLELAESLKGLLEVGEGLVDLPDLADVDLHPELTHLG